MKERQTPARNNTDNTIAGTSDLTSELKDSARILPTSWLEFWLEFWLGGLGEKSSCGQSRP